MEPCEKTYIDKGKDLLESLANFPPFGRSYIKVTILENQKQNQIEPFDEFSRWTEHEVRFLSLLFI